MSASFYCGKIVILQLEILDIKLKKRENKGSVERP